MSDLNDDVSTPGGDNSNKKKLDKQAIELRRGMVLDFMIRGHLDTQHMASKLNVSERTIRRDVSHINKYFTKQFHTLSAAIPAIHTRMLLGYFHILEVANDTIDTNKDPNVKIQACYLAESAMGKILEITGSGNRLLDEYMKQFRKKVEIERRAHIQSGLRQ